MTIKIEPWDYVDEIFEKYPQTKDFFKSRGVCVINIPTMFTIEQFLVDINWKDVEKTIKEMEKYIEEN